MFACLLQMYALFNVYFFVSSYKNNIFSYNE